MNPDYADELAADHAALEVNPFAESLATETHVPVSSDRAEALRRADELCVACSQLTLIVGYPFHRQYAVTVHAASPAGFTRAELFEHVVRVFTAMYEGVATEPGPLKLQSRVESPRFGTAWHRLDELAIEQVLVQRHDDGTALAWISIGS